METNFLLVIILGITLFLFLLVLSAILFLEFRERSRKKLHQVFKSNPSIAHQQLSTSGFSGNDEEDITSYPIKDIPKSGLFSASERQAEYRRRGKSPSGVIDGVYNDMYREDGHSYNDMDRDWDADA